MPHRPGAGYVIACRVLAPLAIMSLPPVVADAQLDTMTSHCFQFDRQYFHWGGRPPGGGEFLYDSSAVVRLSPELHPSTDRAPVRRLLVPSMEVDSRSRRRWESFSYWQLRDADTVVVSWTNGMYGPVFLMEVGGDTLRGRVRFTTDVHGAEPPPEDAWAVRITCS